jgi:pilus assembly protein CpaB
MKSRRFRIDPRLAAVVAALLTGAVAYVAARHYLASEERAAEARVAERHQKRAVLVARTDLSAGTVLDAGVLAARQIPVRYVAGSAALPDDVARVEGQRLLHDVRSGEPILWPSLAGGEDTTLSAGLERGRRALTFPVDEVNALSGMLTPGDVIDLLYTAPGTAGVPAVRPLLQRVTVLATGRSTGRGDADDGAPGTSSADFATITLDLTPDQAQLVVLAQRAGELTAVLRHPADAAVPPGRTVDANALTERTVRRMAAGPRDYVDVITGGTRGVASRTRLTAGDAPSGPRSLDGPVHSAEPASAPPPARESATAPAPAPDPGDLSTRLGLDRPTTSARAGD